MSTQTQEDTRWNGTTDTYIPDDEAIASALEPLNPHRDVARAIDPFDHEVIRHRLWMINDEHANVLKRMSGSPIVVYGHDFNTSLLLENGEWVYFGPYILFLNAGADHAVKWIIENRSRDGGISEGDIFMTNDPWIGTNHTIDVVMASPVYHEGKLFCWVSNHVHHSDLGGITPGSFCPTAETIYEEAAPFPPMRIVEGGKMQREVEEMLLRNSRSPELVALDLRAGVAGCKVAAERIGELLDQFGAATVKGVMRNVVDSSERSFLEKLDGIPDGTWTESMDIEFVQPDERKLSHLALSMTKEGDRLLFENAGTDPQCGSQSCTLIGMRGAIGAALMPTLTYDQLFAIGGMLRHVEVRPTPETLSTAAPPNAVSCYVSVVMCYMRMAVSCIGRAMATKESLRSDIFTSSGAVPYPIPQFYGEADDGTPFFTMCMEPMASGTSAFGKRDGIASGGHFWDPRAGIPNVEEAELITRVLYLYRREAADSGGAGRFRGGAGIEAAMITHDTQEIVHAVAGGGSIVPGTIGLFGGSPATTIGRTLARDTAVRSLLSAGRIPVSREEIGGEIEELVPGHLSLQHGDDVYMLRANGGGGFGDPIEREPDAVANDVANGWVSAAEGARVFGVVLVPDGSVDAAATSSRRLEIRGERLGGEPPGGPGRREARLLSIADILDVVDEGSNAVLSCAACGTIVGDAGNGDLDGASVSERSLIAIAPSITSGGEALDPEMVLREVACPGCARLLDVGIGRAQGAAPAVTSLRMEAAR